MNCTSHSTASWFRVAILLAALALIGDSLPAQSQGKSPVKPPTQSASQPKDDPLGPLLQQAKDAIDKNDFSVALEPLQKYIAERPDDPYAHFQLGYADAGLMHWEDAKAEFSRAIALDPKMAPAYLNLGLVLWIPIQEGLQRRFAVQLTCSPPKAARDFCLASLSNVPGNLPRLSSNTARRW